MSQYLTQQQFTFDCDDRACKNTVLVEVGPVDASATARRLAGAHGWVVFSKGRRLGWYAYCPHHHTKREP